MRLFTLILLIVILTVPGFPAQAAEMIDFPIVKLQSLDKTTARTMTFEARVGSTIKYGPLYIKIQSCRKAPPIEKPESAAFLQVWEVDLKTDEPEWVFSGWMFASSPALSPVNHPVYDVWVLDCLPDTEQIESDATVNTAGDENGEQEIIEDVVDSEASAVSETEATE